MITTSMICNGCGEDIDPLTDYSQEFYLELKSVAKGRRGPVSYAANKGYPIETAHFHGLNCLGIYYQEKI